MGLKHTVSRLIAVVMRLKPVRVLMHYAQRRGPILAAGLSYQAIFAVFAGIWVTFAIAGFVIRANPALEQGLFDVLATSVPGLIDGGDGGAIDPDRLLSAQILGWTGAIAAAGLLFTALNWLAAGREAVRSMFGLTGPAGNFALLKLKDLGVAVGFGIVVLASAAISVGSTAALGWVFDLVGVDEESVPATVLARGTGLLIAFVIDTALLIVFYRVVSGIRAPLRLLLGGAWIAGAALGVLKALGTSLLGGATNNPLLAGFAVIIGLLIWFNLVCQVILIGAAWAAVGARDRRIDITVDRGAEGTEPTGTEVAL